jgi:hypothetical protein
LEDVSDPRRPTRRLVVAAVKGFPFDLDWSEGNTDPTVSILIRTQDAKFYLIGSDKTESALRELDNPQ